MLAANSEADVPIESAVRQGVAVAQRAERGVRDRSAIRPRMIYNIGPRRGLWAPTASARPRTSPDLVRPRRRCRYLDRRFARQDNGLWLRS